MTTNELFAELNVLRANANLKPLKAWKESRAKLEAAVAKLTAEFAPVEAKPAAKPVKVTVAKPDTRLTKVQRAKLRRAGFKAPYALDAEQLAILAGDKRKK